MRARLAVLVTLVPLALAAQGSIAEKAQVLTSATAEVKVQPDRATLVFSVESRAVTAARTGAAAARKQRAVLDTLRARGIDAEQMAAASINIYPELAKPGENKPPRVKDYVVRNSVRVEIRNVDQTRVLIDAALAKEATGIGSLQFSSSRRDEARRGATRRDKAPRGATSDARARGDEGKRQSGIDGEGS